MRKVLFLALFLVSTITFSQAPQFLNYQAIARDAAGTIVTTPIGIKFEILQGSASGTLVYEETNNITPSSAGVFTAAIGNGSPVVGTFSTINWANSPYFIRVSIDPTGGTSYSTVGTSQLLSVPYALYAEKAGNSQTFTAGTGITINSGTITNASPNQTVNISGAGVTGSYPNYTITPAGALTASTGISISGGTITNTAPDQIVTISGAVGTYPNFTVTPTPATSLTATGTSILITGTGPGFTIVPQPSLSISGNQLSIADGNTVTLPTGTTYTNGVGIGLTSGTIITNALPDQTVVISNGTNVTVNGTYPNFTVNAVPTLSLAGNNLSISGGNVVTLPSSPATTVTAGTNMVVSGTAPTYTVATPAYSLNFSNSSTGILSNGISSSGVSLPQPTLTLSGSSSNVLSAGSNSITIATYSAGSGLLLGGTFPNFSLSTTSTGTTAGWSTLGNTGTNAGVNFLGTTDAQDLVFRTGNSQRMRLYNPSGFVGIGNLSTVTENLQVETGGSLTAVSILSGTNASLYFGNTGNHQRGRIVYDNTSDLMSFGTNGSTGQMGITSTGKVGIGTTGPSELLQLQSSGNSDISILSPGGSFASLAFGFTGNHFMGRIQYDITNNTMNFWTNNISNRLFIDGAGKVGIGTNLPVSELDVTGSMRLSGSRLFLGSVGGINSGYTGIYENSSDLKFAVFQPGAPSNPPFAAGGNSYDALTIDSPSGYVGMGINNPGQQLHIYSSGTNVGLAIDGGAAGRSRLGFLPGGVDNGEVGFKNHLTFGTISDATLVMSTEHMRLTSAGNLGIGTISPGSKLHVAGAVTIADGSQGAGKILTSNTAGLASWKTNQVAFFCGGNPTNTTLAYSASQTATLVFNSGASSLNLNVGGGYSAATGMFTAPVAGVYQFDAVCVFAGPTNGFCQLKLRHNSGNLIAEQEGFYNAIGQNWFSGKVAGTVHLNAGEKVYVEYYAGSAGGATFYQDKSSFSGHLVYAD